MRIVAHRGHTRAAPENSMPAFLSATAAGADAVERMFASVLTAFLWSITSRLVKCAHFGGLRLFRSSGWRGYG